MTVVTRAPLQVVRTDLAHRWRQLYRPGPSPKPGNVHEDGPDQAPLRASLAVASTSLTQVRWTVGAPLRRLAKQKC